MRKSIILSLFVLILLPFIGHSVSNDGDKILGKWVVGSGKAHILIYKYGEKYAGKIAWLKEPLNEKGQPKMDKNNPDASKHTNPLLGNVNMLGFEYDGDNTWEDGTIYDSENGKTYSCTMKLKDDNTLDVRGYIGISMIGRTDTWKRVK
jgi:uncharacterized protein (DUF2147 family)